MHSVPSIAAKLLLVGVIAVSGLGFCSAHDALKGAASAHHAEGAQAAFDAHVTDAHCEGRAESAKNGSRISSRGDHERAPLATAIASLPAVAAVMVKGHPAKASPGITKRPEAPPGHRIMRC